MGLFKADIHDSLQKCRTMGIFDHFTNYTDATLWTKGTAGGGASVANNDGDGGILTLTTGATANNEAQIYSTRKLFTFVANKPMVAQFGLKYTEANTDDAGIVVGFASSWTNILADTTFALPSSLSGALIYKKPGDTLWSAFASVGTTQSSQQSIATCQQAGIMQYFTIECVPDQGGYIEVTFRQGPYGIAGGTPGYTPMLPNVTSMARQQPIKFYISYTSAAAMQLGVFVKASSSNSEVVSLDFAGAEFLSIP